MDQPGAPRILVIKLSALGDFIQALGAFRAIRRHHRGAHITLLTTAPYVGLAEASGCFDAVWQDPRARPWQLGHWLGLARRLRQAGFARVYDLQRSDRSGWYFRLLGPERPEWVGSVAGCSHRYRDPAEARPIGERHAGLLALAGIAEVPAPDLSFLSADVGRFALKAPYALLVPGSAPHRPLKRWPAERYLELARAFARRQITPVLIGGAAERAVLRGIAAACPPARDLGGQTSLAQLASLARGARVAVGNDTGPMHVIAAAGCPSVVLFSRDSNPVKSRPAGPGVTVLQRDKLADLPLAEVVSAAERIERRT